ncbi:hypothetical protein GCM10011352_19350 [Marinobacterium zhoushanense]|uniref:Uncharacterized protein n=1 Tax=Marinobacterium zhoushanense TaxID=1679163 RepID=A0ABQ1KB51_9GAMM|nr:hypothetical protein [Marinobacterium zhoushanense]GGB93408.1 hypothetical protein GCM10011352_19350 [Marinobacterium zhoushanense]
MTGKRYFQISLLAPLIVPLCAPVLFYTGIGLLETLAAVLFFSLIYAGPAYLVFGLAVLFFTRNMSVSQIRRVSYFAPFIFIGILLLIAILAKLLWFQHAEFESIFPISVFILIFGYMYVGLVNLIYELSFKEEEDCI